MFCFTSTLLYGFWFHLIFDSPRQGCIKFRNSRPELTGIKAVNYNFEGKIKPFLSHFSIFSPFSTDFSQIEGKINCFSVKTSQYFKSTDGPAPRYVRPLNPNSLVHVASGPGIDLKLFPWPCRTVK